MVEMTYRQLFREIMFYGTFDRMPVLHWGGWPETRERWLKEGLPPNVGEHAFFNASPWCSMIVPKLDLLPAFPEEILEETAEYRIKRAADGVVQQEWKSQSCIPHYMDYTLKEARDWPEFKRRLQPDPARIPANLDKLIADCEASNRPIIFHNASMMGWIRNWMGVENMSYLMYDARDVYADMVMTLADLTCWAMDIVLPKVKADMAFGWEDICGKSGPLVSPAIFDECVAPGYRKIRQRLEHYGVKLLGIDSDGDVSALVGHWLDAGVNFHFPVEVGTWGGDALALRRRYGRELRVFGHFNKLALERGRPAIRAELDRVLPLMRQGGYLPMPDHLITPGVPLDDYRWYLDQVRQIRL